MANHAYLNQGWIDNSFQWSKLETQKTQCYITNNSQMKNHLETRRILIENTKQFFQQRCWKCLMHLYNYNKRYETFTNMIKENNIKHVPSVLGVLSPLCYINNLSTTLSTPLLPPMQPPITCTGQLVMAQLISCAKNGSDWRRRERTSHTKPSSNMPKITRWQ